MMTVGKFVFRMQSLLDLKTQMEQSIKNELGRAIQEMERQKRILNGLIEEREVYIFNVNQMYEKSVTVAKLREYSTYISYLNDRVRVQQDNVIIARNNVDKYREKLIKAMQEKKMFDKLKEKKHEEYMKEQLKVEQKLNDEIVSFNIVHDGLGEY
ncbi:MAG: flagellar export protein FliJ [Fibrobacter sp.]|nr:flagellar export protein FliJ [Fibrobacter sp.]